MEVPHYQDQGLLLLNSSSDSTEIFVPGVGYIQPPDVQEYFRLPQADNSKSASDCCRSFAEAAATSTILLNSFQELELPPIEDLQDPDTYFVEVQSHLYQLKCYSVVCRVCVGCSCFYMCLVLPPKCAETL